jgi:hypothetical protein
MVTTISIEPEVLEKLKEQLGEKSITSAVRTVVLAYLSTEEDKQKVEALDAAIRAQEDRLNLLKREREDLMKEITKKARVKKEKKDLTNSLPEYVERFKSWLLTSEWKFILVENEHVVSCTNENRNQFEKAINDFRETLSAGEQLRFEPKAFAEKMLETLENA